MKPNFMIMALILISLLLPLLSTDNPALITLVIVALNFAVVASNWDLLFGHGGIWSLGQLGFFAIGAYSSALLTKFYGVSPWIAILVGVGISIASALTLSLVATRIGTTTYFALATLGFHMLVRGVVVMIYPGAIFGIPHLQIGGISFEVLNNTGYYYSFLGLFIIYMIIQKKILSSKIGLATIALRDNEILAVSLGIEATKVRMFLFLISASFTSIAGSIYVHYTNSVSQAILGLDLFLTYFLILALGGIGTFYGASLASFIWIFLDFALRLVITEWRLIIMGIIVVLSLVYLDRGIAGFIFLRERK